MSLPLTGAGPSAASQAYIDRVIADHSPIACWPQADLTGSQCTEVVNGWHGTYSGVTLNDAAGPDGQPVPRYDGANDYTDLFSVSLASAMIQAQMTVVFWAKTDVWGNGDYLFSLTYSSGDITYAFLSDVGGLEGVRYGANWNGFANALLVPGLKDANWNLWAYRWKWVANGDVIRWYKNGVKTSYLHMGANLPQGTLTNFVIGASSATPANVLDGWIGPVFLFDSALEAAALTDIGVV